MPNARYEVVENPAWKGVEPSGLTESACHDLSHCFDIACQCGFTMHIHESQLAEVPSLAEVGSRCKGCGGLLLFPPGFFQGAFARMRREGWIK